VSFAVFAVKFNRKDRKEGAEGARKNNKLFPGAVYEGKALTPRKALWLSQRERGQKYT
jgi:hypothetical protein